jgi:hypothetical protein
LRGSKEPCCDHTVDAKHLDENDDAIVSAMRSC